VKLRAIELPDKPELIDPFLLAALLMFVILLMVFLSQQSQGQAIPDAPSATPPPYVCHIRSTGMTYPCSYQPDHPAGFWKFRKSWQDPLLRTNKQVLHSKVFWLSHGALWASAIVACRNPRSGEDWHSEMPAAAAVTVLDYWDFRLFTGGFMFPPALYGTAHYIYAATK
jgi:hypothetical protein